MSVEFEENSLSRNQSSRILYSQIAPGNRVPKIVTALVRSGIVKTESHANYILIGFFFCSILLSLFLVYTTTNPETAQQTRRNLINSTY